jgi:hypothetical protein
MKRAIAGLLVLVRRAVAPAVAFDGDHCMFAPFGAIMPG